MTDDSTEWEYEYDPEEVDTYYVTLDLTSHLLPTLRGKGNNTAKPDTKPADRKSDEVSQQLVEGVEISQKGHTQQEQSKNPLQIIDLQSDNPLIAYNKQLYSCSWATDVGTSVFLSAPSENLDLEYNPLRSFKTFDLVGTTSARLMGVPVKVRPRLVPLSAARRDENYSSEDVTTLGDGEIIKFSAEHGLQIDLPSTASTHKVSQARFLERLSTLKRQRGQMDHVPVKPIKTYNRPDNWEQEREDWLAQERAEKAQKQAEAETLGVNEPSQDNESGASSQQPSAETEMSLTELFKSRKRIRRYTSRKTDEGRRPPGRPRKIVLDKEKTAESGVEQTRAGSERAATESETAGSPSESAVQVDEQETQDTQIEEEQ